MTAVPPPRRARPAGRHAEQGAPQRVAEAVPMRDRIAAWRRKHPMPTPTERAADKAFFDDLSGEP